MSWPTALLDSAERLLKQLIALDPEPDPASALAARLNVLERLIELLRLRAGTLHNTLTMDEFLRLGMVVTAPGPLDPPSMTVGRTTLTVEAGSNRYRRQSELQVALLMQLLHARSDRGRIGDDLHGFVFAVRNGLVPADLQTTRTGVTRIATTTRSAARALRAYGLLRDSDETRTRRWELSLLGILTAVELSRGTPTIGLPPHGEFRPSQFRFGESDRLSLTVERVVCRFRSTDAVSRALFALCVRDRDTFPTFNAVVTTLAEYCAVLDAQWRALDEKRRTRTSEEVRLAADAMLRTVEAAVPARALIKAVNMSLAFDQLPGFERPDRF